MRFLVTILAFLSTATFADTMVTIKTKDLKKETTELRSQGFDIAGINLEEKTVSIVLPDEAVGYFKKEIRPGVIKTEPLPVPDADYKSPDEVATIIRDYASQYPDLASPVIIGTSLEDRLIWALKLSSNVNVKDGSKKVVLFDGMHHAREIMTTEIALDIIDYLLTHYATDAKVKQWLDTTEVWVVPMLNVDGNARVWSGNSMWRKNARGGYGVDINRNYPLTWNSCSGASSNKNADDYKGEAAGSEPETQALMNLARMIKPKIDVSFHTFSEIVIYPMGCQNLRMDPADEPVVKKIGQELASKLKRDSGNGSYEPGTAYELLYEVSGGSIDWMYKELKTYPLVIEFNSSNQGFQPSYRPWRDATVQKARPGWQYILDVVHTL